MAERIPVYLDFYNGQIVEMATDDSLPTYAAQLPVGYVLVKNSSDNPNGDLGYGAWTSLGSQTIGVTTVYYFERTE